MADRYIATVGVSIRDSFTTKAIRHIQTGAIPRDRDPQWLEEWWEQLVALCPKGGETIPEAHLRKLGSPNGWRPSISAERDSLEAWTRSRGGSLSGSFITLLTTDTPEGRAAAFANAALLGGWVYLHAGHPTSAVQVSSAHFATDNEPASVKVYAVPGLDPGEDLRVGLPQFALAVQFFTNTGEPPWVCLSGGLKGQIPALLTACEYLKGLGKIGGAFLKHEDRDAPLQIRLRPVTLPDNLAQRLNEKSATDELNGFAWENGEFTEVGHLLSELSSQPGRPT